MAPRDWRPMRGAVRKFDETKIALPGARTHGCQPPAAVNNDMCRRLRFRGVLASERDAGPVGAPVRNTRRRMRARLAAPSRQRHVPGSPASYAHRACPVMAQRTAQHRWGGALGRGAGQTAKMEDVPRAKWQGHRARSLASGIQTGVVAVRVEGL